LLNAFTTVLWQTSSIFVIVRPVSHGAEIHSETERANQSQR